MNKNNNKRGGKANHPGPAHKPAAAQASPRPNPGVSSNRQSYNRASEKGAGPLVGVAAAYSSQQRSQAPRINASRDQCRIVHRELVASVTGSVAFTVAQALALNPGLSATFPWLASQAQNWEQYRFDRLKLCYYTRTGSDVPGSVQLIPDYDAADSAPSSEQIASTYEDVSEDAPWKDISCVLRTAAMHPMGPKKFIRTGPLAANLDVKTYDVGNFFLATMDGTAVNWGKLWIEYDVTLFSPQMPPAGSGALAGQHYSTVTPTTASNFGSAATPTSSPQLASMSGNVLTFSQAGRYLLAGILTATTSVSQVTPVVSASGSITFGPEVLGVTADLYYVLVVQAAVGTTVTFGSVLVGGNGGDLWVAQVPGSLL